MKITSQILIAVLMITLLLKPHAWAQWEPINNGHTLNSVRIVANDSYVIVGTNDSGVFRSTNAGLSWTPVNSGLDYRQIGPIMLIPDGTGGTNLFVGTAVGVYRSSNYGGNWSGIDNGINHWNISALGYAGDGGPGTILFAGSWDGHMYRSTNNGTQWLEADSGINQGTGFWSIVTCPAKTSGSYIFAQSIGGLIFRSADEGISWTEADSGIHTYFMYALAVSRHKSGETSIFASGGGGLYRSTDYGSTWSHFYDTDPGSIWSLAVTSDDTGGQIVLAGSSPAVIMSRDDGSTWTSVSDGLPGNAPLDIAITPNRKMAFATTGGVWARALKEMIGPPVTTLLKLGNGWNLISVPSVVADYRVTFLFPSAVSAAYTYRNEYSGEDTLANGVGYWLRFSDTQSISITGMPLAHSVNVRAGWNLMGTISTLVDVGTITSIPAGIVTSQFFAYQNGYIQCNTLEPGSAYWVKTDQDGKLILYSILDSTGLSNRICIRPTSERPPLPPKDGPTMNDIPNRFAMTPNYPNPFNPSTTIEYELPTDAKVSLKVYNLLGQVVAVLEDGVEQAGYKQVEWNASKFPMGIYFYRLDAISVADPSKSFTSVKKMVFIK